MRLNPQKREIVRIVRTWRYDDHATVQARQILTTTGRGAIAEIGTWTYGYADRVIPNATERDKRRCLSEYILGSLSAIPGARASGSRLFRVSTCQLWVYIQRFWRNDENP